MDKMEQQKYIADRIYRLADNKLTFVECMDISKFVVNSKYSYCAGYKKGADDGACAIRTAIKNILNIGG